MLHILLIVSISLFQSVQSENPTFNGSISSDLSLSNYYETFAKDFVSKRLRGKNLRISIDYEQF